MTGISSGIGDGDGDKAVKAQNAPSEKARRSSPPVILPADIARRPRYQTAPSATGPGDALFLDKASASPPAASNPSARDLKPHDVVRFSRLREAPPLIDRIIEHFAALPDGGGDLGMALAGAVAESDGDEKALAIRLGLARKPGQRRVETIVKKLSRDDGIRELAAGHPDLKGRALWRLVSREFGVSPGTARRALEQH